MPQTVDTLSTEVLWEKEIKRLQGEAGNAEANLNRLLKERDTVQETVNHLHGEVEKAQANLDSLKEKHKAWEASFSESRAHSITALEKRDKESGDLLEKAVARDEVSSVLEAKALSARNSLIGLAGDVLALLSQFEEGFLKLSDSIRPQLEQFQALVSPEAEIPGDSKKKA